MNVVFLPYNQLSPTLMCEDRAERFISGKITDDGESVIFMRGNGRLLEASLDCFETCGDGTAPDFSRFALDDYGCTIAFGEYEASARSVIRQFDPDYHFWCRPAKTLD